MRPLDRLPSIKVKLGVVIVATVVGHGARAARLGARLGPVAAGARARSRRRSGCSCVQLLARGMTSPLREMAAAASAMARGDHAVRVRATSRDEVGELARAFNTMAAQLADVDRQRRDLVANVSHELRTPIGALQALLENLVDGVEPPDPRDAARSRWRRPSGSGGSSRSCSTCRAWSRARCRSQPGRVRGPAAARAGAARVRAGRRRARAAEGLRAARRPRRATAIPSACTRSSPTCSTTRSATRPPDGRVWLSAHARRRRDDDRGRRRGRRASRRTRPSGCSSASTAPTAARSARDGGTGLGLAIARWIVDAHGGAIRAEHARARTAAAWWWSCRAERALQAARQTPRGARVLRGRVGRAAGGPRAVGVAPPARAAARRGAARASGCSTSAAAPGASSPRCATRAPTPSASSSPRRRSSARGATCPAPTCGSSRPTAACRSAHGEVDLVWCSEVLEHVPDTIALPHRGAARAAARRPAARDRARPRPPQAHAARARPLRRALRPARPARALLHAPLARPRAARDRLRRTSDARRSAGRRCCAARSSRARSGASGRDSPPAAPFARLASRKSDVDDGVARVEEVGGAERRERVGRLVERGELEAAEPAPRLGARGLDAARPPRSASSALASRPRCSSM